MHEWSSGDEEAIEIWMRSKEACGRSSGARGRSSEVRGRSSWLDQAGEVGAPARASAMPQPMPRPATLER